MRRKFKGGNKEILQLRNKKRKLLSNRKDLLRIVEEFYTTLYTHQNQLPKCSFKVQNQSSEDVPNF